MKSQSMLSLSAWLLAVLVVPLTKFKKVQSILERLGEKGHTIGRIVKGERKVVYS